MCFLVHLGVDGSLLRISTSLIDTSLRVPTHSFTLVNHSLLNCKLLDANDHDRFVSVFSYHNASLRTGPVTYLIVQFGAEFYG